MMLAVALLIISHSGSVPDVADYFPSTVDTVWEYQENNNPKATYEDKVINPVDISGASSITIQTSRNDKILGTSHYRISDNTVFAVAFNTSLIVDRPHPILRISEKKIKWDYKGTTPKERGSTPMEFKASSWPIAQRELFGQLRDCYQVELEAKFTEAKGLLSYEVKQSSIHAKGIGMVELTESTLYNKVTTTRKVSLIRFGQSK